MEQAHIAQLKYYLYKLEQEGILANYGLLEYPKTRETKRVELSVEDRVQIPHWEANIGRIISAESCPEVIDKPVCKQCAFYEFCYVEEL
jgi:CRISPR-associated exonuclease Cas4